MPSLITHYIFAKKEYSKCVDKFNFLVGNFDAFAMGNQGLNIFSYNDRIIDFNYDRKFFSEGIIEKVVEFDFEKFFIGFEEVISTYQDENKKKIAYSFMLGLLCNYALERRIQPFLYYRTGFQTDGSENQLDIRNHKRHETLIDFSIRNYYKYSIENNKPKNALEIEKNRLDSLSNIFYEVVKHVYPNSVIKNSTYSDFVISRRKYEKNISLISRDFVYLLGLKNTKIGSDILPKKLRKNEKIDYLNVTHQVWHDPVTFKESNESVVEMIEDELENTYDTFSFLIDSYKGKKISNKIQKYCQNLNFYGQQPGKNRMYQHSLFK